MDNTEFLVAAQSYAGSRNETHLFVASYNRYREFMGVRASANFALYDLYGDDCPLVEGFD